MIWIVRFADVEAAIFAAGFAFVGETSTSKRYMRGAVSLSVRKPGANGTLPMSEVDRAFNDADIDPPELKQSFSD